MKKTLLISLLFCLVSHAGFSQTQIVVATQGNDKNSGTVRSPLRSVAAALKKAVTVKNDSVKIILRGGTYYISETIEIDSTLSVPVTLCAWPGEKVSFSGGVSMPARSAVRVNDRIARGRLQEHLRDSIRVVDLAAAGIPLEGLHHVGFGRPNVPSWTEIFVDGEPMKLSRWPNDSMAPIGEIIEAGNNQTDKSRGLPIFKYGEDRPARWGDVSDMWIGGYFAHGYADDMIKAQSIDTVARTMNMAEPTHYGFMTGEPWRRWYAVNLLEEIDLPGEYAIDSKAGKIYFYPRSEQIRNLNISVLEEPMLAITGTSNIAIRGVTFEYSRGIGVYIERGEHIRIDSCTFRNLGNVAIVMGHGAMPITNEGINADARIVGRAQEYIYDNILWNRDAGKDIGISNCHIYNVGAGGIHLSGGDRATLTPAGNFVENCRIHDYNRIERSYRPGVGIDGVGNRVSKCDIYNAPSMAILFHGNDHVIELCDIHNVCSEVDDQGAIYYGRDPSERGHVVRHCYFHDLDKRFRVSATYHDDGACDMLVYGNVYYKAGWKSALIGGGHDNRYINNIFIESPFAIHVDNRMQNWGVGMVAPGGVIDKRLKTVKYTEPPYSKAYPELVAYWEEDPSLPKRNIIEGNLFYDTEQVLAGSEAWVEMWNNWTTHQNPGFIDPTDPMKGLSPNAEVYKKIAGFQPIPFENIGCSLPE